jgi:hypothetical protein
MPRFVVLPNLLMCAGGLVLGLLVSCGVEGESVAVPVRCKQAWADYASVVRSGPPKAQRTQGYPHNTPGDDAAVRTLHECVHPSIWWAASEPYRAIVGTDRDALLDKWCDDYEEAEPYVCVPP